MTNIWAWVFEKQNELRQNGQHRLADIMDDLPSHVVDNEVEQVEAMVPEGLALARSLNEKWVELFIRHWNLQDLVLTRMEVKTALAEAVSLLEFSHQEDTRDCPQSVCVVQDLANCYAHRDGPGFAEQRLAVAEEALQRIDPSWTCFSCIGEEYADTLLDREQFEQTLAFLDECDVKLQTAGKGRDTGSLLEKRVYALIGLGRFDEAENAAARLDNPYGGETFEMARKIIRALVQAHLGNTEAALKLLPPVPADNEQAACWPWAKTQCVIAAKVARHNTTDLAVDIHRIVQRLLDKGVYRDSLELCFLACQLALDRDRPATARILLDMCPGIVDNLNLPLDAHDKLARLEQAYQAVIDMAQPRPPPDVENLLDGEIPREQLPLEERLALLQAAMKNQPGHQDLVIELAQTLDQLGFAPQARQLMKQHLEANPDAARVLNAYGGYLLGRNPEQLKTFLQQQQDQTRDAECRQNIQWLWARYYRKKADPQNARRHLEALLEQDPDLYNTRVMLATTLRDLQLYPEALAHVEYLLQHEDDENLHWDRMVLATLLEEWEKVRASAQKLDIQLQGSGAIEEDWGPCRIRIVEDNHSDFYIATRTGPVTARIEGISRIDGRQHHGDCLIFDPYALNELSIKDEDGDMVDEEGYDTYLYPCVKITTPGGYTTFDIDGVHPGEHKVEALLDMLRQTGAVVSRRSSEEYVLTHEQQEREYPGIYIYFLVPPTQDPALYHEKLTNFCRDLEQPLVWLKLLQTLGEEQMLRQQQAICASYGIE